VAVVEQTPAPPHMTVAKSPSDLSKGNET
jgi:hypothetical protein